MKVNRKWAGFYQSDCGRVEVTHITYPDTNNGYGRIDHWVAVVDGCPWDPFPTLREAREAVRVYA